jgi:hypothetical protein
MSADPAKDLPGDVQLITGPDPTIKQINAAQIQHVVEHNRKEVEIDKTQAIDQVGEKLDDKKPAEQL